MAIDQERKEHLAAIQQVIGRLNGNSFSIKGWSITAILGLLSLNTAQFLQGRYVVLVAFAGTVCFWLLDSYYLQQERKFRKLYDEVLEPTDPQNPIAPFTMPVGRFTKDKCSFHSAVVAAPSLLQYLSLLTLCAVVLAHMIFPSFLGDIVKLIENK